jgi:hypothetical protein
MLIGRTSLLLMVVASGPACSLRTVHVSELALSYSRPMAVPIEATAVVVLRDVPDYYRTQRGAHRPMKVEELQTFVTRDFKALMGSYFTTVLEQTADAPVASAPPPEVFIDVSIGGIELRNVYLNGLCSAMDWSVGVRRTNVDSYIFTYTGRVTGTTYAATIWSTPRMLAGTLQTALMDFAGAYGRAEVQQDVRDALRVSGPAVPTPELPSSSVP